MTAAVSTQAGFDQTDAPTIARASVRLGLMESAAVLLVSLILRYLNGPLALAAAGVVVASGLALLTVLPGSWTKARTIEGIAGAAGIGLGATVVFLIVDVALLQPIGTYSHRWLDIGGGSNWWYHPVWWMVGTFIPWFGAWILANQTSKSGSPSVPAALATTFAMAVVCAVAGILLKVPGAGWGLGTFAVAYLPGLALATLISVLGARRA
jgi:hypothetical protein